LEGLLEALRQSFTGATGAVGGVQEGLEGILDPLQAALDEATAGVPGPVELPVIPGDEYDPAIPGEGDVPPDGEAAEPTLDDLLNIMNEVISGMAGADPLDIDALRADPMTASLLADLEKARGEDEEELRSKLQEFGVLRGGGTADLYGELFGEYGRTELDVLSDAAKRAETRRTEGLVRGTDLADLLSRREISIADLMGELEGAPTLGGREHDLTLLASIISSLDPNLNIPSDTLTELVNTIFGGMGGKGFKEEDIKALQKVIREGGLRQDPEVASVSGGRVTGNDPDGRAQAFMDDHPALADGDFIIYPAREYPQDGDQIQHRDSGVPVARYSKKQSRWRPWTD
jgi:hypothetical protein